MVDNVTLDGIRTAAEYDLISLYDQLDDVDDPADNNSPFQYANASCKYYEANDFTKLTAVINDPLSFFHLNCMEPRSPLTLLVSVRFTNAVMTLEPVSLGTMN